MYTLLLVLLLPFHIHSQHRIIGGNTENITSVPYQLSFRRAGVHICGAAILAAKTAITAAHCLPAPAPYSIKAGVTNLEEPGEVVHVQKALVHPQYSHTSTDYDIAILYLATPLSLSSKIKPVGLPSEGFSNRVKDGMIGKVSGWGATNRDAKSVLSRQLLSVELPVVTWRKCNEIYYRLLTERMFCAGLPKGGKDSCSGDSGGPFVINGVMYGIVSGGMDCAQPGFPGIYTDVQVLRAFIRDNAGV